MQFYTCRLIVFILRDKTLKCSGQLQQLVKTATLHSSKRYYVTAKFNLLVKILIEEMNE